MIIQGWCQVCKKIKWVQSSRPWTKIGVCKECSR